MTRPSPSPVTDDGLVERFRACVNAAPSNGNVVLTWDTANKLLAALAASDRDVLVGRIAELEEENARLSKVVCSDVLGGLLTEDENEALVAFVKELRRAALIPLAGELS